MNRHTRKRQRKGPLDKPPSPWDSDSTTTFEGKPASNKIRDPKRALSVGDQRHDDSKRARRFSDAVESLALCDENLGAVIQRTRDWMEGQADAAHPSTRLWCFEHSRGVEHAIDEWVDPNLMCDKLERFQSHADVPGETAIGDDIGRRFEQELFDAMADVERVSEKMLRICQALTPRQPLEVEQIRTGKDVDDDEPGCECCARVKICNQCRKPSTLRTRKCSSCRSKDFTVAWSKSRTKAPSSVGGNLVVPAFLCHWCEQVVRMTGRRPSFGESARHVLGQRVQVRISPSESVTV